MNRQIMRSKEPMVLECPFELLSEITPNDLFYVRNHFPPPNIPARRTPSRSAAR